MCRALFDDNRIAHNTDVLDTRGLHVQPFLIARVVTASIPSHKARELKRVLDRAVKKSPKKFIIDLLGWD